ncbi:MAG: hypothetical protein GY729_19770, partial [Desulfobacteraceae bacterium]|nr:hypothetical protein [Desulfobacteraceae bacterium]
MVKAKNCLLWMKLLIVILLLVVGCGSEKEAQKVQGLALIEQDLEQKKITKEEALVFKAFAMFNHPDLPDEYKMVRQVRSASLLLLEIKTKWSTFSDQTKKQLRPFYVSPADEDCFIYQDWKPKRAKNYGLIKEANAADPTEPPSQAQRSRMKKLEPANQATLIWYKNNKTQKKMARIVLEAFDTDKLYENETQYLGYKHMPDYVVEDTRIDIFFVKGMNSDGLCGPLGNFNNNRKYSGWIAINTNQLAKKNAKKMIKSVLTHELFHALQYAIDFGDETWWWWQEATATWAEHHFYRSYDREKMYITDYLWDYKMRLSMARYGKGDCHEYAAYLFPLYLDQTEGNDRIAKIWKACEPANKKVMDVLKSNPNKTFKDRFKGFALWLYNQPPVKNYKDNGKPLTDLEPEMVEVSVKSDNSHQAERMVIQNLGILMESWQVDDDSVKSIDFSLEKLHKKHPYVGVWAIIKIAG